MSSNKEQRGSVSYAFFRRFYFIIIIQLFKPLIKQHPAQGAPYDPKNMSPFNHLHLSLEMGDFSCRVF